MKLALAGLVVAAVAAIAVAVTLVSGPRSVACPIDESQALLVAWDFAPTGHALALSSTDVTGWRRLYEFSAFVDMRAPASSSVTVSRIQASAAASAFLVLHGIPTDGLEATFELLDHVDTSEFQVRFAGRVNGARTPNVRVVSVDPGTGRVYGFVPGRPLARPAARPAPHSR